MGQKFSPPPPLDPSKPDQVHDSDPPFYALKRAEVGSFGSPSSKKRRKKAREKHDLHLKVGTKPRVTKMGWRCVARMLPR